jgi:hypothetical protein
MHAQLPPSLPHSHLWVQVRLKKLQGKAASASAGTAEQWVSGTKLHICKGAANYTALNQLSICALGLMCTSPSGCRVLTDLPLPS